MPLIHAPEADEPIEVPADAIELGEDEDIDNDDLPDGLVTQDTINEAIGNRLPRAYKQALESVGLDPEDFKDEDGNYDLSDLDSDTTFQRLAEQRGIDLREDGKPKGSLKDDEIQDLQEKAQKYESVKDELDELRESRRQSKIDDAWETFKEHAPPIRDGAEEILRKDFEDRVAIDDEHGVVPVDEDGNLRKDDVTHAPEDVDSLAAELPDQMGFAFEDVELDGPDTEPGGSVEGEAMTRKQFQQEVEKARQEGNMERMNELEELEANDQIIE
jgi:hypothetical protein